MKNREKSDGAGLAKEKNNEWKTKRTARLSCVTIFMLFFSTKDRHFCFRQQLFEFSLYQFWLPCTFADYPRRTQVTPHVQRERWYFVAVRQISVNLQSKRIYIFIRKKSLFFFLYRRFFSFAVSFVIAFVCSLSSRLFSCIVLFIIAKLDSV